MEKEKVSYQEVIKKIKPEFEKTISFLEKELQQIRTSRVSPSLVEDIEVEYLSQRFKLKQLSAISLSGPREIVIQPWDSSFIEAIVKSLEKKDFGTNSIVEKNLIRIVFPPLSEEFRRELLKLVSQKREEARQKIRKLREEAWGKIQSAFKEGKISEDEKYKGKNELQKLIDEYNEKIDEITEKKEKEISE